MQLQPAQLLETVVAPVRSRSGGDTDPGGKAFWELLAEHGPVRAKAAPPERAQNSEESVEATPAESPEEGDPPPSAVAAHAPDQEPRGESPQAERDELTLAAAIAAGFQPLTIHTLNDQLLRVDVSLSPKSARQTDAKSGLNAVSSRESGIGHSVETQSETEHSASTDPRLAESHERAPNRAPVPSQQSTEKAPDALQASAGRLSLDEPVRPADAQAAGLQQPVAGSRVAQSAAPTAAAAAASGMIPNTPRGAEAASPRATPQDPAQTTPIAGASGRKAGSDAQMPRWDAQKSPADAQRGGGNAAPQRNAAMVAAQATKGLAVALSRADGTVTLRLNPESLGFVRIKLEMGKGTVLARFEASTNQARQLLEQSSETLRASLEAKGWETSQVRVELLREVDPAGEMLRKLEQQAAVALDRHAAQDATAGQEQWAGGSGGDREHRQAMPDPSSHGRDDEPGEKPIGPIGASAERFASMGLLSRIDTIV